MLRGWSAHRANAQVRLRRIFQLTLYAALFMLAPTIVLAQGVLENPSNNSAQSGVGIISGWYCSASKIEVVIDDAITAQAAYGTTRGDTQGACGDTNNGFGLLVNWNNLAPGSHLVRVLADGNQFAQVGVHVATFGTNFLRGQSGAFTFSFAGKNVKIEWNESMQNFMISEVTDAGGGSGGGGGGDPNADLQALLGRWSFTYTILVTFTDVFSFNELRAVNGHTAIAGTNSSGGTIAVARTQDLVPGSTLPHKFFLINIDSILCQYYNFDQVGPNQLTGLYVFAKVISGQCGEISSNIYTLTGTRLNALTILPESVNQESEKLRMGSGSERSPLHAAFEEAGEAIAADVEE